MKQHTIKDMEELSEGEHEDSINYLRTAYKQVQYVFDELGTGFDELTAGRINMLKGRLGCAVRELEKVANSIERYDKIL